MNTELSFRILQRAQSFLMNITSHQTLEAQREAKAATVYADIAERELHHIAELMGFRLEPIDRPAAIPSMKVAAE